MKILSVKNGQEVFRHSNQSLVWEVFNADYNNGEFKVYSLDW